MQHVSDVFCFLCDFFSVEADGVVVVDVCARDLAVDGAEILVVDVDCDFFFGLWVVCLAFWCDDEFFVAFLVQVDEISFFEAVLVEPVFWE